MIIDKLTKAYLQIGSGLTLEDAQHLAKKELEMRLQFQKDWQAGKVAQECRLFRQSMKRQRDAAAAYYADNPAGILKQVRQHAPPCTDFNGKNSGASGIFAESTASPPALTESVSRGAGIRKGHLQKNQSLAEASLARITREKILSRWLKCAKHGGSVNPLLKPGVTAALICKGL